MMCQDCHALPVTRIVRDEVTGGKFTRYICKSCGKAYVDSTMKKRGRPNYIIQRWTPPL